MCFRPNTDDTHQLSSVPHGIMDTSVSASGRYRSVVSVVSVVSFLRLQFGGEERSMAKIRPGGWKSWERDISYFRDIGYNFWWWHKYKEIVHKCFAFLGISREYPGETVVVPRRYGNKIRVRTRNPVEFSTISKCFQGLTLWPFHVFIVYQRSLWIQDWAGLNRFPTFWVAILFFNASRSYESYW